VDVLAIDPQNPANVFARATDYGLSSQSTTLFQTTDSGNTWNAVNSISANVSAVVFDPQISNTVYAATDRGVSRSNDRGATWATLDRGLAGLTVTALAVDPNDTSILYAGTSCGVLTIHLVTPIQ
jgi:photosystem II stability/assembly factor-like uncharacterized protein